jgi:hypothetical protein
MIHATPHVIYHESYTILTNQRPSILVMLTGAIYIDCCFLDLIKWFYGVVGYHFCLTWMNSSCAQAVLSSSLSGINSFCDYVALFLHLFECSGIAVESGGWGKKINRIPFFFLFGDLDGG